jgi:transketolase C-terminal domain/subunit
MISSRGTFGTTMKEIVKEEDNIIILSGDLGNSSGLARFIKS